MHTLFRILAMLLCFHAWQSMAAPQLRVHAGSLDRQNTIVQIRLPADWNQFNTLQDPQGGRLPLQMASDGRAFFVLPSLPARTSRTYTLARTSPDSAVFGPETKILSTQSELAIAVPGFSTLIYQTTPLPLPREDIPPIYARGGYLHPIRTPSGRLVTDDYPPNHIHHHGIWYAWTKTQFGDLTPDFWNMGQGKGTVDFVAVDRTWHGPVFGGFISRHNHRELMSDTDQVVLKETWTVRAYRVSGRQAVFDIESDQTCVADKPLHLPPYHYGGTGIRGNRAWDGKDNAFFLTSEGIRDRVRGNESRARWCYIGGIVDGQQAGIAIFCHVENVRYPQPVRLHPNEPYFSYAPQQLGDMTIQPEETYRMQYRHVLIDGAPDAAELDRQFQDYISPPDVELLGE